MHAWDCRHCAARNAPNLVCCHGCGAARATAMARRIAPACYRPPGALRQTVEALRLALWVLAVLPLFLAVAGLALLVLGGLPVAGAMLLMVGGILFYVARIAGAVSR